MKKKQIDLSKISEEELLHTRICDLPLEIKGTWLQDRVNDLYRELDGKGIGFKPECYLADEWLTPDGEPTIGIPFYLADDALIRLEKKMMLEAEGWTNEWCMQLLRHEAGHAINHAYRLSKKKKWQKIFGSPDKEYGETYRFRPYSRSYVRHLEDYYAQYHPDEDFSETFAVWLTPHSDWQQRYQGWRALVKLKFVEQLMEEIKDKESVVKKGKKDWRLSTLRVTLKNYYKKKRAYGAEDFPDFHDVNLKRIFSEKEESGKNAPAASDLLKTNRLQILKSIANWTGEKKYITDDLLKKIGKRCRELKLIATDEDQAAIIKISTYITALIMNYRYTGRLRGNK